MDLLVLEKNLKEKGYDVKTVETKNEAALYLNEMIDNTSVGFGGSVTLEELGVYDSLGEHNEVFWHNRLPEGKTSKELRDAAINTKVYLSSVNGISMDGTIINIDATGNRVGAIMYGHEKVYLVIGRNKVAEDFDSAMFRARNIAAPLNARRLNRKTPCAVNADRCYDCKSKDRLCNIFAVMPNKPNFSNIEIILVNEDLGY